MLGRRRAAADAARARGRGRGPALTALRSQRGLLRPARRPSRAHRRSLRCCHACRGCCRPARGANRTRAGAGTGLILQPHRGYTRRRYQQWWRRRCRGAGRQCCPAQSALVRGPIRRYLFPSGGTSGCERRADAADGGNAGDDTVAWHGSGTERRGADACGGAGSLALRPAAASARPGGAPRELDARESFPHRAGSPACRRRGCAQPVPIRRPAAAVALRGAAGSVGPGAARDGRHTAAARDTAWDWRCEHGPVAGQGRGWCHQRQPLRRAGAQGTRISGPSCRPRQLAAEQGTVRVQAPLANPFAAGAKPAAASPGAPNPFASLDNDAWSKAAEKTSTPPQAAPLAEAPVAPAPAPAPAVSPWDSMGKAAAAVRPRLNDPKECR